MMFGRGGGEAIGEAWVRVRADTSAFAADAQKGLLASGAGLAALGVAAGAGVAAGVAAGLFKVGSSFDAAYDTIRIKTGAVGDTLKGLQDSFKTVVSTVPADFGAAGEAIAAVNQRLGLTGPALETMAAQQLELARITGGELGPTIEATTRLMGAFQISGENMSGALDALFRASQATGPSVDQLASTMVQFGPSLRQMGFSFEESAALLGKFEKEGVNTSRVLSAMRIGLAEFTKDGKSAPEAFRQVITQIATMGSETEATALALEVFGRRAGVDMAAAIRQGRFDIDELFTAISGGSDTILGAARETEDFAEKWKRLSNRILVGIQPAASAVFDFTGTAMDRLGPLADRYLPRLSAATRDVFEGVVAGVRWALPFFTKARDGVKAMLAGFSGEGVTSDGFIGAMERIGVAVRDLVTNVVRWWPAIQATVKQVWATLGQFFEWMVMTFWPAVGRVIRSVVSQIVEWWPTISKVSVAVFRGVAAAVRWVVDDAFPALMRAGRTLADWWRAAWPTIETVAVGTFRAVSAAVRWVVDDAFPAVIAAAGWMSDQWKRMWRVISVPVKAFVAFWSERWPTIQKIAENVGSKISAAFRIVAGAMRLLVTAAQPFIRLWLNILKPALLIVAGGLFVVGRAVIWLVQKFRFFDYIKTIVQSVIKVVSGFVDIVLGLLSGEWGRAWDGAKRVVGGFVDAMWNTMQRIPQMIGAVIGLVVSTLWDMGGILVDKGAELLSGLLDGMKNGAVAVIGWLGELPAQAFEWVGNVVSTFAPKGVDLITGLLTGIGNKIVDLWTWLTNLPGELLSHLPSLATTIKDRGVDLIKGFKDGVEERAESLWAWLKNLPANIAGRIPSMLGTLLSAGKDLIQGFINGVISMAGSIVSAIATWITDKIPWYVKKALGIESPSTVMMALGEQTMAGYVKGLERGGLKVVPAVKAALAGVSDVPVIPAVKAALPDVPAIRAGVSMVSAGSRQPAAFSPGAVTFNGPVTFGVTRPETAVDELESVMWRARVA